MIGPLVIEIAGPLYAAPPTWSESRAITQLQA